MIGGALMVGAFAFGRGALRIGTLVATGAAAAGPLGILVGAMVVEATPRPAVATTTWYVDGINGSDSNNGTSSAAPRKTLPTIADGDIVKLSGPIRSAVMPMGATTGGACINSFATSRVTIEQWTGMPQAELRGDYLLEQHGWTPSGNSWQKAIEPGLAIDAVGYKLDTNTDADGDHYGFLAHDSLSNVQNAAGIIGRYNYDSATGLLSIYLGGENPNTSGYPVSMCVINSAGMAIAFTGGGSGNSVIGLNFAYYPTMGAQNGWAVCFNGSGYGTVLNCSAHDMGAHCFGTLGAANQNNSGCRIIGCTARAVRPDGTQMVFNQLANAGNLQRCMVISCRIHGRRWLGTDGRPLLGLASNSQIAVYSHINFGTGGPGLLSDLLIDGAVFTNYGDGSNGEDEFRPCDNNPWETVPPADNWTWRTYSMRMDRCVLKNFANVWFGCDIAMRRTTIDLSRAGSAGLQNFDDRGSLSSYHGMLLESCEVRLDLTTTAEVEGITCRTMQGGAPANGTVILVNTSVWDNGTASPNGNPLLCIGGNGQGAFYARGCIFGMRTGGRLMFGDAGGMVDFKDNAYYDNFTWGWSSVPGRGTRVAWLANMDTSATAADVVGSIPFSNLPTDLSIDAASPLWTLRRNTSTRLPAFGLNAPYHAYFGAWQYPAVGVDTAMLIAPRSPAR